MEKLVINWRSEENALFVNPRTPPELQQKIRRAWTKVQSQYRSHVGLLTSGSSGSSKLVLISKNALLEAAQGANEHLLSGRSDTWLKTLPEFHVGGLSIYARTHLSGARIVEYERPWSPQEVYELAVREKATLLSLVPTQLFDFVQKEILAPPTLRALIIGGGALQSELYQRACELSWPVLPSYGLTECGSQVATAAMESHLRNEPSLNLLPHVKVKLSTDRKLMIKSPALLTSYVDIETAEVFDPKVEGWFETEDIAELHGRELSIIGRTQDFLKIGGESVDFSALQKTFEQVCQSLGVKGDAALLPIPDKRLGFVIVILSAQVPQAQLSEITEAYNSRVMPFERVRFYKETDSIPRSELGKLLRTKAVEEYLRLP